MNPDALPATTERAAPDPLARMLSLVFGAGTLAAVAWVSLGESTATRIAERAVLTEGAQHAEPPPPPVEPFELRALTPDEARAANAAVPYSAAPNPAAKPFRFIGSENDLERAVDCLAAANIYEAGDDTDGQRAVAQVVLNRVRHPAFPRTVCGVVFEGQERRTGCQFTFTCDGALARDVRGDAWERARMIARAALSGKVDKRVGHATHYHTDWVVPYWSATLDKITAVGTHLFFRWAGWWGTPPAFRDGYAGGEPVISKLAQLSAAHRGGDAVTSVPDTEVVNAAARRVVQNGDEFIVTLDPGLAPEHYAMLAAQICGARSYCKLLGWSEGAAPKGFPIEPAHLATMHFSYLRDTARKFDKALWNCAFHKRQDARDCMKTRTPTPGAAAVAPAAGPALPVFVPVTPAPKGIGPAANASAEAEVAR